MTKPYHLSVIKKHGTKTESELAELKAKYKDGVPSEIIDHVAEKLARVWTSDDDDGEVRVIE
jgi:hypothetical protein